MQWQTLVAPATEEAEVVGAVGPTILFFVLFETGSYYVV